MTSSCWYVCKRKGFYKGSYKRCILPFHLQFGKSKIKEGANLIESSTHLMFFLPATALSVKCTACAFTKGQRIPECCVQNKYMLHLPGYLFPNPSGKERDWKRERGRKRKHGWRLFGLCPLRTGLTGAKFRLSAPASLSFTQADKYTHTLAAGVTSY